MAVGPVTVCGPGPVSADLAAVAVAGIDDEIALVDDEPVAVSDLWAEVLDSAGAGARSLTLVCPTWWSTERCDRVREAARDSDVVVMRRVQALSDFPPGVSSVVVEIADEVVMVSGVDTGDIALARHCEGDPNPDTVVRAVIALAGTSAQVVVDAPAEVVGAVPLGHAVAAALRGRGVVANVADTWFWRDTLSCRTTRPRSRSVAGDGLVGARYARLRLRLRLRRWCWVGSSLPGADPRTIRR